MELKKNRVALVISGGLVKGAFQAGALRALSEFIRPDEICCVSAASVGALNGYSYIMNGTDRTCDIWREACQEQKISLLKFIRQGGVKESINAAYSFGKPVPCDMYFPLYCLAENKVSYCNLREVFDDDLRLDYLKASVSLPIFGECIKIDNHRYFDGAIVDNIPMYPLIEMDFDYAICLYFSDRKIMFENEEFDSKIIKLVFPSASIFGEMSDSVMLDRCNIDNMIDSGYSITYKELSRVFRNGTNDLDTIYNAIKERGGEDNENKLRVSGDVLIENINKVSRFFVKRRDV